jgi:hypothetical protein
MHRAIRSIIVIAFGVANIASAEEFVWSHNGRLIGRLNVPKGIAAETYDYREGIVTTLHYGDGSFIVLQSGGMYRIPFFQGPEHNLVSSRELDAKTIRTGRFVDTNLWWREDDYKRGKAGTGAVGWFALFPPNIGYGKVSPTRRAEFDQSLDSFVPEGGRGTSNH